jgi:LmbE family N-acetylglucosaminyl deacetylase
MFPSAPYSSATFRKFLVRLSDKSALTIPAYHIAIIVAHPDDETIHCGATLKRLKGARVVVVTDGVLRRGSERAAYSLPASRTPEIARWRELIAALELAGQPPGAAIGLAVADCKAAEHLVALTRRIAEVFHRSGTAIAITHAYEGHDPDHDATAFAVHQAVASCRRKGQDIAILEMPYRRKRHSNVASDSAEDSAQTISLRLTAKEKALKRRMLACFERRHEAVTRGALETEEFRVAPAYDFAELPGGGHISYGDEACQLGPARWCDLVASARQRLDGDEALRRH